MLFSLSARWSIDNKGNWAHQPKKRKSSTELFILLIGLWSKLICIVPQEKNVATLHIAIIYLNSKLFE